MSDEVSRTIIATAKFLWCWNCYFNDMLKI